MKKIVKFILYIIMFSININVLAFGYTVNDEKSYSDYSTVYKDWLALDDEARAKVPEPSKYNVEYKVKRNMLKNGLNGLRNRVIIPSSYDLRDVNGVNYTSPIKDQGDTSLCWAFSATSAFETNYYMRNGKKVIYNPLHMSNALEHNFSDKPNPYGSRRIDTGGFFYDATDYWTSGIGPIAEFSGNGKEIMTAKATMDNDVTTKVDSYYELPIFDLNKHSIDELPDFVNFVKQEIMNNGEVVISTGAPQYSSSYYNATYYAAYTDNYKDYTENAHAMTIIGWDDDFSKEKFNPGTSTGQKPSIDGAWIVRNSWGDGYCYDLEELIVDYREYYEEYENHTYTREEIISMIIDDGYEISSDGQSACYDDNHGIVYYSYQDFNLNRSMQVITNTSDIDYDYLYQYTPTGSWVINEDGVGGVIIFDKSKEEEELTEISFDLMPNDSDFNVGYQIYVNPNNADLDNNSFTLVEEASGIPPYYAYYTVKLDEPITLTGEQYAIKILITNGNMYSHQKHNSSISKKSIVGVIAGQSYYIDSNGNLIDVANSDASLYIKAMTKKKTASNNVAVNTVLKYGNNLSMSNNQEIDLKSITNNISNGEVLTYKVFNSSNIEVTSSFNLTESIVLNNMVINNLKLNTNLELDNYKIKTYYLNELVDEDDLFFVEDIIVNNVETISNNYLNNMLYHGIAGSVNFHITAALTDLDNLEITVLDNNNQDVTSNFTITSTEVNNQLNVSVAISNNVDIGNYKVNILKPVDNIQKQVPFTVNDFVDIDSVTIEYNSETIDSIILLQNDSLEIEAIVAPNDASSSVILSPEDEAIVSITGNVITGLSVGSTNITIGGANYQSTIPITVIGAPSVTYGNLQMESTIGNSSIDEHYGGVYTKAVTLSNYDENYMHFDFTNNLEAFTIALSSNEDSISVTYSTGLNENDYTINAPIKVSDTKGTIIDESFDITIAKYFPVQTVQTIDELTIKVGEYSSNELNISVSPSTATYRSCRCASLDTSIVTVDSSCNINALRVGNTMIEVTSLDNEQINSMVVINVEPGYVEFDESLMVSNGNIKKLEYNGIMLGYTDLTNLITTNKPISIYKSDHQTLINEDENLKTGMFIMIGEEGYNIIIQGDTSGDGIFSLIDLSQMRKHLAGVEGSIKEGSYLAACDMNYDDRVSILDLSQMRTKLAGDN